MKKHKSKCRLFFYVLMLAASLPTLATAQMSVDQYIKQFSTGDKRDQVDAIRGLGSLIIHEHADAADRETMFAFFDKATENEDANLRLTTYVELLKIAATENDAALASKAMLAVKDNNINVRRGILKFFRTFYSGRFDFGKSQQSRLVTILDDQDLESRYQAAATLHSWGVSNDKILETMVNSLELTNYRATSVYSLVRSEDDRMATIEKLVDRLENSEHNQNIYINVLSLMTPESNPTLKNILPKYVSDEVAVRASVVDAIGRMRSEKEQCLAVLAKAIDDSNPAIRQLSLSALVRLEPDLVLVKNTLFKLLDDDEQTVRAAAGNSVALFEGSFEFIIDDIRNIFRDGDFKQILPLLLGLANCGPMAESMTPDVIQLLQHEDSEVQIRACWALLEITSSRDKAKTALIDLIERSEDQRVINVALQTLSQFLPTDDASKEVFLKFLDSHNEFVRYACVYGLRKYSAEPFAERLLNVECRRNEKYDNQLRQLDRMIVEHLIESGKSVFEVAARYVDDADPFLRSRAMRVLAHSPNLSDGQTAKIVQALDDESPVVQFSAAVAASKMKTATPEILERIFELTSPNDRQRTVNILNLFGELGADAAPVTTKIAGMLDGIHRNRFANDARAILVKLGPHAKPALSKLASGNLTNPKLECIAAVGIKDEIVATFIRKHIATVDERMQKTTNVNSITYDRRNLLLAAVALGRVSDDYSVAQSLIRKSLHNDARAVALNSVTKIASQSPGLIDDVVALLPEKDAINTLAAIGPPAKSTVKVLNDLTKSKDPESVFLAKRALWHVEMQPDLAIETVNELLHQNRFETVDVRVEQRHKIWEAVRFLFDHFATDPKVKSFLEQVRRSRFPNLRTFAKELE